MVAHSAGVVNDEKVQALLDRCHDIVLFAVHEFGGGYNTDGTPKGEPGSWDGITQLLDDLEDARERQGLTRTPPSDVPGADSETVRAGKP